VDKVSLPQPRARTVQGQGFLIHEAWLWDGKGQGFADPVR
jgi:hypothetical protein